MNRHINWIITKLSRTIVQRVVQKNDDYQAAQLKSFFDLLASNEMLYAVAQLLQMASIIWIAEADGARNVKLSAYANALTQLSPIKHTTPAFDNATTQAIDVQAEKNRAQNTSLSLPNTVNI